MKLAIYSTKQYDKKYLQQVNEAFGFELEFFDFLLTEKTAKTAHGCDETGTYARRVFNVC